MNPHSEYPLPKGCERQGERFSVCSFIVALFPHALESRFQSAAVPDEASRSEGRGG